MTDGTVNQPSAKPTAKVLATWVTGAGATVVLAVIAYVSDSVDSETVYGSLIAAVLAGVAGWVKANRATDRGGA